MSFFFSGFLIGGSLVFWFKRRDAAKLLKLEILQEQVLSFQNENKELQKAIIDFSGKNATLEQQLQSSHLQIRDFQQTKAQLALEFENLANKIFNEKMMSFKNDSSQSLEVVLKPFKERLSDFQQTVVKYREDEVKETSSLKSQLDHIVKLNQQLASEAHHLTQALKGDNKTQGNWGELILSKILEASGLREGVEYIIQGTDLALSNSEGQQLKPDVVVMLPENKHLILDSKVTLVSYERFVNADNEATRDLAKKDFIKSLREHIKELSAKKYQNLDKVISPDFVLLFIPIEGAFSCALQLDASLFVTAWEKKVILVSPTTLMVTLRTVESIWRQEKQNKYALQIATQAGDLYDKFVGFTEDLEKIKNSIDAASRNYESVMNKLKTGKGSIVSRFEKLKTLGAKATKTLNIDYDE